MAVSSVTFAVTWPTAIAGSAANVAHSVVSSAFFCGGGLRRGRQCRGDGLHVGDDAGIVAAFRLLLRGVNRAGEAGHLIGGECLDLASRPSRPVRVP